VTSGWEVSFAIFTPVFGYKHFDAGIGCSKRLFFMAFAEISDIRHLSLSWSFEKRCRQEPTEFDRGKAGAEVYEYQPSMIHAKVICVDDLWSVVGSTNFDNRSFGINDEGNLACAMRRLRCGSGAIWPLIFRRAGESRSMSGDTGRK
jgi:hypothetical protein